MPTARLSRNTFVAGALSPWLAARDDLAQYPSGLRRCENFFVVPQGGLTRRTGTEFVAKAKYSNSPCRLIPFQYSVVETYIIELGDKYLRFYAKGGQLLDDNGAVVEVLNTPWSGNQVFDVAYAQLADKMYIVHPDHPPYILTRTTVSSFSLSAVTFTDGRAPMGGLNLDAANYPTITGAWPNMTITMVKDTFTSGDVGRIFYVRNIKAKNSWYLQIASVSNAKTATATGLYRFNDGGTSPSGVNGYRWAMSLFSTGKGCSTVAFHEGRLLYGGFARAPNMIWMSVSDDFDNFEYESPDPSATDASNANRAIQRRLTAGGSMVNTVRWAAPLGERFVVGTSGDEVVLTTNNDNMLTPASAWPKRQTSRGSAKVEPVTIDNALFFMQRGNSRIRQMAFDIYQSGLVAKEISVLSDHLLRGGNGVRSMTYQQEPYSLLWVLRLDGKMAAWTVDRDQSVVAAHLHTLGGPGARIESVVSAPADPPAGAYRTGFSGTVTTLVNTNAEAGDTSGWVVAGDMAALPSLGATAPAGGSFMFASAAGGGAMYQDLNLEELSGFSAPLVDDGLSTVNLSVSAAAAGDGLDVHVRVDALGDDGSFISTVFDTSGTPLTQAGEWQTLSTPGLTIPPSCRKLRIHLIGASSGACFDDLVVRVSQVDDIDTSTMRVTEDELWMVVRRRVGGTVTRYVERMTPAFRPTEDKDAIYLARFLDCSLRRDEREPVAAFVPVSPTSVRVSVRGAETDIRVGDSVRFFGIDEASPFAPLNIGRYTVASSHGTSGFVIDVDIDLTGSVSYSDELLNATVGAERRVLQGFDHLNGERVSVLADGAVYNDVLVSEGSITLDDPAVVVETGYNFTSLAEIMPLFLEGTSGTDQGLSKSLGRVMLRCLQTLGGYAARGSGPTAEFHRLRGRDVSDLSDGPPSLFTGDQIVNFKGRHSDLPTVTVKQDLPLPFTLLGAYIETVVSNT